LASLRALPNTLVIRPADAAETAAAWQVALTERHAPTALILSRQKLPAYDRNTYPAADVARGAYVLREASTGVPQAIIIGTGSEVSLAMQAAAQLEAEGIATRVVSMPCQELFERQSAAYKAQVLPASVTNRVVIEAGVSFGWERYVGINGGLITVDRFGASAPAGEIYTNLGITAAAAVAAVKARLA
jgi:transketolase